MMGSRRVDEHLEKCSADLSALMNVSQDAGRSFWNLLKNITCHDAYEQWLQDKTRDVFEFEIMPLGKVKMKRDGKEWSVVGVEFSEMFIGSLNETLRCGESNLHRELYDRNLLRLNKYLDNYSDSLKV